MYHYCIILYYQVINHKRGQTIFICSVFKNRHKIQTLGAENKQDAEVYKKKSNEAFLASLGWNLAALGGTVALWDHG
jgi:hypothetical protein